MSEKALTKLADRGAPEMSLDQVKNHIGLIQKILREVMRDGEHYGRIPGCGPKPTLLKPGAEKLSLTFRLAPSYEIRRTDLPGGHREYEVICTLTHIPTGTALGQGVGSCSTMEAKYRNRAGDVEYLGIPVPPKYWQTRDKNLLGGDGYTAKKNPATGQWEIVKLAQRTEHDNPADHYNTVLKMAKKRAHVDAVLTVTAASDTFTQDVEDYVEPDAQHAAQAQTDRILEALRSAGVTGDELDLVDEYLAAKSAESGRSIEAVCAAAAKRPDQFVSGFRRWVEHRQMVQG